VVLTIKRLRRRNWSFLRPVPSFWQLALGALLLTAVLHLVFGTLFRYRSTPLTRPADRGGELQLLNCGRESRWKRQLELRNPAKVTGSSGEDGFLAQLPKKNKQLLQQRPNIPEPVSSSAVPGFQKLDTRISRHYSWRPLPPLNFHAGKEPEVPLVLTDTGMPLVFPEGALPAASAEKPSVWQVRSVQGISLMVLLSSCGRKELDEVSRIALAESSPAPGNYLFYWTGGQGK